MSRLQAHRAVGTTYPQRHNVAGDDRAFLVMPAAAPRDALATQGPAPVVVLDYRIAPKAPTRNPNASIATAKLRK